MAPTPGNTRVIYGAVQSAKGTPATNPTHKFSLNGDNAGTPGRELIQLPETDSSAQRVDNTVVGASPVLSWSNWVRGSEFAFLAKGIQGANVDAGSGPYTHTAAPTMAMPYYTFWDVIPGVMCTRYDDCRFNTLGISGEALAGIAYSASVVALSATLGVTEPTLPAAGATDIKYSYPMVAVSVGGSHPGTFDSINVQINRNITVLRGDNGFAAYDSVPGIYIVEGTGIRKIFSSDADYRKYHGGSAGATVLTTVVFTEAFDLLMTAAAGNTIDIAAPAIEYTETTVPVNVDGAPILQTLGFSTKRQATLAANTVIVTTNALATSAASPT